MMRSGWLATMLIGLVANSTYAQDPVIENRCAQLKSEQEEYERTNQYRLLNETIQLRAKECPAPATFLEAAIALIRINDIVDPQEEAGSPQKVAERRLQAMDYLQEALRRRDSPLNPTEAALAEGHIRKLEESLVVVQVVPADIGSRATVEVDGEPVALVGDRFWVIPGAHTVVVRPSESGLDPLVQDLSETQPGSVHVLDVRFPIAISKLAGYRFVISPADAAILVDGQPARTDSQGLVWLAPGQHSLRIEAEGYVPHEAVLDSQPGKTEMREVALREREDSGPFPIGPVVAGGTGVAMLTAGVITGALAASKESELADNCGADKVCDASYADTWDDAQGLATATDILLIGGGVVLAGGVVWWLLTMDDEPEQAPATAFTPVVPPKEVGLLIHQRF